ncbi:25226_t:CDS:1, partial [Gigaspora rosea]
HSLSEQLKNFSNLACERRIAFIKKTFENNKSSLPPPIPVTTQEEKAAMSEENMSKAELLTTINSLLTSINTSDCI